MKPQNLGQVAMIENREMPVGHLGIGIAIGIAIAIGYRL
jgi:hypothetical protein